MKHYDISISGKVQGVFFRKSTLEIARLLGLKGFVRNEINGNVCIEAEGTEEQLKMLVSWCKIGPAGSVVGDVKFSEGEIKNFLTFEIL